MRTTAFPARYLWWALIALAVAAFAVFVSWLIVPEIVSAVVLIAVRTVIDLVASVARAVK